MDNKFKSISMGILSIVVFVILWFVSRSNYLLFHFIVENFSVCIGITIFIIAFNGRKYFENDYIIILGTGYLFITILDFLHAIGIKEVNVFYDYDYYSEQIFIAARYLESFVYITTFYMIGKKRKIPFYGVAGVMTVIFMSIIYTVFYSDTFPICYIEGIGYTRFYLFSMYISIGILILSLVLLWRKKERLQVLLYRDLFFAVSAMILSMLLYTIGSDVFKEVEIVAHYFKVVAYYLIYRAIVSTSISNPYRLVFEELTKTKESLEETNIQLENKVEDAVGANEAKSKYLSIMGHEMRNNLNGIFGFVGLMENTRMDSTQNDYLNNLTISARELEGTINDILDFEKFSQKRMVMSDEHFNLGKLFFDRTIVHKSIANAKGLKYYIDIDDSVDAWVEADKKKMTQLINNLISNAIKYTEEGYVRIAASATKKKDLLEIQLKVSDSGSGISKEERELIFEPFVQSENRNKDVLGSGLGLAICKEICHAYDGDIKVLGQRSKGSTFLATFTLQIRDEYSALASQEQEGTDSLAKPIGENVYRILIAEDNLVNQKLLERYLSKYEVEFKIVQNGKEAVDEVLAAKYDAILMDCQMPVMDGLEATRQIRKAGFSIPIVAMTAFTSKNDRERCMDAGMDRYFAKPVDLAELEIELKLVEKRLEEEITENNNQPIKKYETEITKLMAHIGFDYETCEELILTFVEEAKASFEQMDKAIINQKEIKEDDIKMLQGKVHTLKGAAASVRLSEFADDFNEMHIYLEAGKINDFLQLFTKTKTDEFYNR